MDYLAQPGDTLPALAAHFNTSVEEIHQANPDLPSNVTTLRAGTYLKIPLTDVALWGNPNQILPDHEFVYGATLLNFNTQSFVSSQEGWLKDVYTWAGRDNRSGAEIVDYVALNYSINPRLLLSILEYQANALSSPEAPDARYILGFNRIYYYDSMYLQLVGAANTLNNGYYGWRSGSLTHFDLADGSLVRPDPWQNAASVALQYYFSQVLSADDYHRAIGPEGLFATYASLFGDPWEDLVDHMPGSLQQPELRFPFPTGQVWTYTGGPHTGWGSGEPYAGIDFAPPSEHSGCFAVHENNYAIAMADGIVVRSETGTVVLDLDGDGDERTGWVIVYLHVATKDRVPTGSSLKAGDLIGYPSCEGGRTTGTHIHIARKYNGEWIPADGPLAFNLEGWIVHMGERPYKGTLTRGNQVVTSCLCSDAYSEIESDPPD